MINIEYPPPSFKMKEENGKEYIFDSFRKLWIRLTPEEWVRQNFLNYLVTVKKYPASLIAVEKEINLHELKRRCDIIVYKKEQPWMIVECKEMNVAINNAVIDQVLSYNQSLNTEYLIITNGNTSYGLATKNKVALTTLPDY
ncbi:MAG: type I restriction enzyme HsdR N-terminal domain-containing protein [Bacteroidota bacterium]|nr:type I restriction enzyme HsdR N-terminal domain-containing protein [Bacteroidota bacterium]